MCFAKFNNFSFDSASPRKQSRSPERSPSPRRSPPSSPEKGKRDATSPPSKSVSPAGRRADSRSPSPRSSNEVLSILYF